MVRSIVLTSLVCSCLFSHAFSQNTPSTQWYLGYSLVREPCEVLSKSIDIKQGKQRVSHPLSKIAGVIVDPDTTRLVLMDGTVAKGEASGKIKLKVQDQVFEKELGKEGFLKLYREFNHDAVKVVSVDGSSEVASDIQTTNRCI